MWSDYNTTLCVYMNMCVLHALYCIIMYMYVYLLTVIIVLYIRRH